MTIDRIFFEKVSFYEKKYSLSRERIITARRRLYLNDDWMIRFPDNRVIRKTALLLNCNTHFLHQETSIHILCNSFAQLVREM